MPPADERLRHLFLAGTARTLHFTPKGGGRRREPPHRDPDSHGRALAAELSRIDESQSELLDQRRRHQLEEVTGTPVTFELMLNPALSLDSLEDRRAGIELLSFRPTGEDTGLAVVFIPEGKLEVFEDKLKAYLDPERLTKKGKRYHQKLINSIDRIRRTVLQDLWTDPLREFPGEDPIWWEVWVRNEAGVDRFRSHAERLEIQVGEHILPFPDRTVVLARATVEQMALSVDLLDSIAELREARSLALELLAMGAQKEVERTSELESRTEPPSEDSPAVCLLDTGIDVGHSLLEPGLDPEDAHSYDENNWGVDDHHGHGTEMGGFALYGTSSRYRYASHGLRFEVKTPVETEAEFLARVNRALREPEEAPSGSSSDSSKWAIGPHVRNRGSLHSDVWTGSASDLAAKDAIVVFPVLGWWRDPRRPEHCERWVRYSLVASIETDAAEVEVEGVTQAVDFYTEVVNAIEVAPEIEILGP